MEQLKKWWDALNGHKTQIALAFYMFQDQIIPIWFSDGVPPTLEKILLSMAVGFATIGLGHAGVKAVKR